MNMDPHTFSVLRSRGAALGLVLSAAILGVVLFSDFSLSEPSKSHAATALNGQPLQSINATYSSETPAFGTLFESASADRHLVLELDSIGVLHLKGLLKDPFEQTIPLESKHFKGSSVQWTIKRDGEKFFGQIQSIQLFATPFQTFEFTLPPGWESFAPTQAVKGTIDARTEGFTVRLNGTLLSSGTLAPPSHSLLTESDGSQAQESFRAPRPTFAYEIGPPRHVMTAVVSKISAPSIVQTSVDGVIRLQWDRVVDPARLPVGSDIGLEIERSIGEGAFQRISVASSGQARMISTVLGTTESVFDTLDLSTVQGKVLRYRIRMTVPDRQSDWAVTNGIVIRAKDLESGPIRLIAPTIASGCGRFSYSVSNRGYTPFRTLDDRFMTIVQIDHDLASEQGFGFRPGVGMILRKTGLSVNSSRRELSPGESIEQEETFCIPQRPGWQNADHTVGVLVDATRLCQACGSASYFFRSGLYGEVYEDNSIKEDNENNNFSVLHVNITACSKGFCLTDPQNRPDLIVQDIVLSDQTLSMVRVAFSVYNRGVATVPAQTPVEVQYWIDGQMRQRNIVPLSFALEPSGEHNGIVLGGWMTMYNNNRPIGASHDLEIRVDTKNTIGELNEDNNTAHAEISAMSTTIICAGQSVDLLSSVNHCGQCARVCPNGNRCDQGVCKVGFADLAIEKAHFDGTRAYVFDVKNIGEAPVTSAAVDIRTVIDGRSQDQRWNISSVINPSAQRTTVTIPLPSGFRLEDPHRIEVLVDPDGKIQENDKQNNTVLERIGTRSLFVHLTKSGNTIALVGATPIISNLVAPIQSESGNAYRAVVDYTGLNQTQAASTTHFSLPTDQRIRLVGGALESQDIGGKKSFTIAIPYNGVAKRLRISELADAASPLIDVSFDEDGGIVNTPSVIQKIAGTIRSGWEKVRATTNALLCRAFGWNSRLNQFFGCSQ